MMGGPMMGLSYMGGGFYRRPMFGMRRPMFGSGGCGCLVLPIVMVLAVVVGAIFLFATPFSTRDANEITKSTVEREPLPAGSVNETAYFTDELGWIRNQSTLLTGMQNFYRKTGVQPYLYLTDSIDGSQSPTAEQAEAFANETYDNLFTDEAHFLLIFFEYNEQYSTWYLAGTQAKTVMDSEASDILLDYVDRYYYDQGMTDEEMFSRAFNDAGERIMTVEKNPWIPVLIVVGALAILLVIIWWWRQNKKQKNLEAQQTQDILNTPLETYGSNEAENLARKYDDK